MHKIYDNLTIDDIHEIRRENEKAERNMTRAEVLEKRRSEVAEFKKWCLSSPNEHVAAFAARF